MEWTEITESFDSIVSEMTTDPGGLVAVPAALAERIRLKDTDPKFATFVIESGWSKSKRFWGPELFNDVATEMNNAAAGNSEPIVGYMGHIKDEDDPFLFPEIQMRWVGAKLQQAGNKARLAVKAYVLPGTKARDYLEEGLVKTVSWRGKIAQEMFSDGIQRGVRVKKFAIESIDLSRPRAAGMSARLVGALTSEMENGGNEVKPEEIAALQANELRAHNPGLVQSIEAEARRPLETQVSEMQSDADAVKPVVAEIPSLKKLLGLADNADDVTVLQAAVRFLREQGKSIRDNLIDSVLKSKKLDGDDKDVKLARRLIVGEMRDQDFNPSGNQDEDLRMVTEMVNRVIDSSEDLKEIVSEMEGSPAQPPARERDRSGSGNRELKPGYKSSRIRVRSAR